MRFKPVPMVDAGPRWSWPSCTNQGYGDINFLEITAATATVGFIILDALGVELDPEMVGAVLPVTSTDTTGSSSLPMSPPTPIRF